MAAIEDRENLERDYDRPSLHSPVKALQTIGRFSVIVDQHRNNEHPSVRSLILKDFCCDICGFDAQVEMFRLYPEYLS